MCSHLAFGGFMRSILITTVISATLAMAAFAEGWDQDVGKPAPALVPGGWVGTPVTLDAVRGNVVILAFWNADIPC
jgi:hypothetical protein